MIPWSQEIIPESRETIPGNQEMIPCAPEIYSPIANQPNIILSALPSINKFPLKCAKSCHSQRVAFSVKLVHPADLVAELRCRVQIVLIEATVSEIWPHQLDCKKIIGKFSVNFSSWPFSLNTNIQGRSICLVFVYFILGERAIVKLANTLVIYFVGQLGHQWSVCVFWSQNCRKNETQYTGRYSRSHFSAVLRPLCTVYRLRLILLQRAEKDRIDLRQINVIKCFNSVGLFLLSWV